MQQFTYLKGGEELTIFLPEADTEIIGEARWATHALCSLLLIGTRST